MTTEDTPLRELGWFPQEYVEALTRYRIRTIHQFYERYLGTNGRASMESVLGISREISQQF